MNYILKNNANNGFFIILNPSDHEFPKSCNYLLSAQCSESYRNKGYKDGDIISHEDFIDLLLSGNAALENNFLTIEKQKLDSDFDALERLSIEAKIQSDKILEEAFNKCQKYEKKCERIKKKCDKLENDIISYEADKRVLILEINNTEKEIQKNQRTLSRLKSVKDENKTLKIDLKIAEREILKLNNSRLAQKLVRIAKKESITKDLHHNLKNKIRLLEIENKNLKKDISDNENIQPPCISVFPNGTEFNEWARTLTENDLISTLHWGEAIVSSGSGPFSCNAFKQILENHNYSVIEPGSVESFVMVVGHDCRIKDVNKQINARGEMGLKIYSQELALFALATKIDPFNSDISALLQEGNKHRIISKLINDIFNWPNIREDYQSSGDSVIDVSDWNDRSPLTTMGYIVGNYSPLSKSQRRSKLKLIFSGKLIFPECFNTSQKNDWGMPNSDKRLKKIAEHIVWNISRFGSRYSHKNAVTAWKEDLEWLQENFFTNRQLASWPNKHVGVERPPNNWLH